MDLLVKKWSKRKVIRMIVNTTRPRVYCEKCGEVLYCDTIRRENPVGIMINRLKKKHKETGCDGKIEYAAGVTFHISRGIVGQGFDGQKS